MKRRVGWTGPGFGWVVMGGLAVALAAAVAALSAEAAPAQDANRAVLAYFAAPAADASGPGIRAAPLPQAVGDAAVGKDYFSGVRPFQNGGPPCLACHSIGGLGALGGGNLGPDLTATFGKFGQAGLAPILATTPFPTMRPIFARHPLTPDEQGHLMAFFQQAAVAERPAEIVGQLALLAVAGAVVLLLLAQLIWRRRLSAVRQPLLGRR